MTDVAIADPDLHTGEEPILREATFNPKVRTYWLLTGAFVLTVSIVGIPLLIFWFPIGYVLTGRYLERVRCVLTEKNLHVARGVLVRQEKTVPLDKITDLAMSHGPIMRQLGLRGLSVETAGQSGPGSLIKLVGIEGTEEFRAAVLAQRERVGAAGGRSTALGVAVGGEGDAGAESTELLSEIRDSLLRIEKRLGDGGGG
ncbi:MAG: PH domain-containing protein [Holophagales bacterium]|nr:PH domain-containing protein [Holophagales bacterium]MYH26015.1 PH domain-containing protein [Holophagales bacterium]